LTSTSSVGGFGFDGAWTGGCRAAEDAAGRRDVPLAPGLSQALWNEREARRAAEGELIFTGSNGQPPTRASRGRARARSHRRL